MDFEQARFNMIKQQIRTWEVLDQKVLDMLFKVRRENFVPAAYRTLAFADTEIPLDHGQYMWPPRMEARVIQDLALIGAENVLEIGTGSGYFTALLAQFAASVTSIEIHPDLLAAAGEKLKQADIKNVMLKAGDAAKDPRKVMGIDQTFDVIVLTGSVPILPPAYLEMLNPGGRLFAVIGDAPVMEASLITCNRSGSWVSRSLFETIVAPLINVLQPVRFSF